MSSAPSRAVVVVTPAVAVPIGASTVSSVSVAILFLTIGLPPSFPTFPEGSPLPPQLPSPPDPPFGVGGRGGREFALVASPSDDPDGIPGVIDVRVMV